MLLLLVSVRDRSLISVAYDTHGKALLTFNNNQKLGLAFLKTLQKPTCIIILEEVEFGPRRHEVVLPPTDTGTSMDIASFGAQICLSM